ncbi:MAG: hypothetical protein R3C61_17730 [Bacteroidia bacterium]
MNDTNLHMMIKQFEFYQLKSPAEKLQIMADMIEFGINQTKVLVEKWYPMVSPQEQRIAFFRLFYREDFDSSQMTQWVNRITPPSQSKTEP